MRSWALPAILLAWTFGASIHWPDACTFRDEVGYVGQARLLLAGHFRPEPDSVCHSLRTSRGEVVEYPPFVPALLAPLFAVTPRAVFAFGVLSALLLAATAGLAVARLGGNPLFGAIVLLHPTVLLLSRTVMADVALAALAVLAWVSLGWSRRVATPAIFALLVLIKPNGIVIAALLLLGALLERRRSKELPIGAAAGAAAGLAAALLLNYLATGGISYAYSASAQGFALEALGSSGLAHLKTLVLVPPLLILGAIPFWKQRYFGPLLVIAGLTVMMSLYAFVDSGRTSLETLVLAPRLILPAVAFLLAGWGALLARFADRWKASSWVAPLLIVAAPIAAHQAGSLHARLQEPAAAARRAAERIADERSADVLGVTPNAFKAGVLSRLPLRAVVPGSDAPAVVLCSMEADSTRAPGPANDCDLPGYELEWSGGTFEVRVRRSS